MHYEFLGAPMDKESSLSAFSSSSRSEKKNIPLIFSKSNTEPKEIFDVDKEVDFLKNDAISLELKFARAAEIISHIIKALKDKKARPSFFTIPLFKELYGLFKQGSIGDCPQSLTRSLNPFTNAKQNIWKAKKGLSKNDAKKAYIVNCLTVLNENNKKELLEFIHKHEDIFKNLPPLIYSEKKLDDDFEKKSSSPRGPFKENI
ncbi:MAG: putative acyl-coa-binding protein [Francisellaceae bacterium]|nr:putative acyl-coa-binding protein [Francisellaceae bacterium]